MQHDKKLVRVWDVPTRIFHWSIAILFLFLILTGENGDWLERHMQAGYVLSGLIVFRFIWGFWGAYYARFVSFLRSPVAVFKYAISLVKGNPTHHYGHNPAGGYMVMVLLFMLLLQALTGLVTTDDILWAGPLYERVPSELADLGATIHRSSESVLQAFVIAHILAVIYHRVRFKEAIVAAMFHGNKKLYHKNASSEQRAQTASNVYMEYKRASTIKLVIAVAMVSAWVAWLFNQPV